MAASNFEKSLSLVLKHEGGWSDDPADPGGATNLGVTIGTLSLWLGRSATKSEVKALTAKTVAPIYRRNYWNAIRADDLPPGLDYAVFDFAVNSGPKRAIIGLQRALGVADDGLIGPVTLAAVQARSSTALTTSVCAGRLAFLRELSTWPRYGRGWERRVDEVRRVALEMAAAAPARPTIASPPRVDPAGPLTPMAPNAARAPVPSGGLLSRIVARLRAAYPVRD